ncbi:tyrosine-type recombinase/integrase [Flavivirga jejuensis]|uniref:Tyrosine-type recombinase/integrase n=1 Tax=Flavivirga jejuensis TaxID=870487 RepID=A0ABT8WK75_9FLAO|nr:tyrosine-type recombinase/integrase [Flavivirga jejuensis]MDO5973518.1 tyrosine-type recombinase/integrase [Flavivirga jejuensis]
MKDKNSMTIKNQLGRYSDAFENIEAECKKMNEEFTSSILKDSFNKVFKKSAAGKNLFFDAYKEFMTEKQKRKEWKSATVKRYTNIENHLKEFEVNKKYKLTFSKINDKFLTEFTDYCYTTLDHNTNTYARNLGLFKTFMYWTLKKRYTYNESFKDFEKPERVVTEEIALTLNQVQTIFEHKTKSKSLERIKDVFVFQCLTGLRYGELALINEHNVKNNVLFLKEDKDVTKDIREIPLFEISNYILKKYDYKLPLITNQKQNEFIKDIFEDAGFNEIVEYTRTQNKEKTTKEKAFKDRVSTHTARRTFITIMKKKGIADKTIMSMTGHKDLKTFNTYYKVDNIARKDAISEAFGSMELPKLKKA